MFQDKIKSLFSSSIQAVVSRISDFAVHPEKDFTRRKKFPADILLAFLIFSRPKFPLLNILWNRDIARKDLTVSISMLFMICIAILIPMPFFSLSIRKMNSAPFARLLTGIRSLMGQKMYISGTGGTVLIITWHMS